MSTAIAKRAHASLGGSNSHAWLKCPASAHLSANIKREATVYTRDGTAAHTVAEHAVIGTAKQWVPGEFMEIDGCYVEVTREMIDCAQVYARAIDNFRPCAVELEQRVSLSWLWESYGKKAPETLFGTSDAILWDRHRKWFGIVDYKFGKSKVSHEGNPQLMFYGLGTLGWLKTEFPQLTWHTMSMTIVQPRSSSPVVRTVELPVLDLLDWAYGELVPAVEAINSEEAAETYTQGNHCYYCAARQICPAWEKKRRTDAASAFPTWIEQEDD